jgi:hypothetical protein
MQIGGLPGWRAWGFGSPDRSLAVWFHQRVEYVLGFPARIAPRRLYRDGRSEEIHDAA